MAVRAGVYDSRQNGARTVTPRLICLILLLSILVSLPGCRGCSCRMRAKTAAELEEEKKQAELRLKLERERLKPPLEVDWLVSEPYSPSVELKSYFYKPGHWTSGMLSALANHDDIVGDLDIGLTDADGRPVGLIATPHTLLSQRDVSLAKKHRKRLETQLFVPASPEDMRITSQIKSRRGGRLFEGPAQVPRQMSAYQYHFVVLARWPERYTYLETLDSCRLPASLRFSTSDQNLYHIVLIRAEKEAPVPASAMFWTSTAAVLWDDAELDALTAEQKIALVDWLHWGGQLIISGPDSLDSLKNSFLTPYLPATGAGARQLQPADLAELNKHWPVEGGNISAASLPLAPRKAWSGIDLRLAPVPQARFVPNTNQLLAERCVGQGRVVVSAFALNGSELTGWNGFDSFFNGCILARKGRVFGVANGQPTIRFKGDSTSLDPRQICQLRYFTRDTVQNFTLPQPATEGTFIDAELKPPLTSDVASWNDSNLTAGAARNSLRNAARIEIPARSFVFWVVGVYLVVLVPLNWLLFRGLDRVEWAWVAAPIIALVCTGVVIRLAQLDIGFARSATEIAVVELQDDYPRAHVTRYTALYTSLSTAYRVLFDEAGAEALPFPARLNDQDARFGRTSLRYRYGNSAELDGLRVLSNSTGLVHSEQMLDLGGGVFLVPNTEDGFDLVNNTKLKLHGVGLMRWVQEKDQPKQLYVAWLDEVEPQSRCPVRFEFRADPPDGKSPWTIYRDSQPETASKSASDQPQTRQQRAAALNIRELTDLAEQEMIGGAKPVGYEQPRPGDARLIAWDRPALAGNGDRARRPADPQRGPRPRPSSTWLPWTAGIRRKHPRRLRRLWTRLP